MCLSQKFYDPSKIENSKSCCYGKLKCIAQIILVPSGTRGIEICRLIAAVVVFGESCRFRCFVFAILLQSYSITIIVVLTTTSASVCL